jgi:diguanylate cyclase (GGDEF)-like protein
MYKWAKSQLVSLPKSCLTKQVYCLILLISLTFVSPFSVKAQTSIAVNTNQETQPQNNATDINGGYFKTLTKWSAKSQRFRQTLKTAPKQTYDNMLKAEDQYAGLVEKAEYHLLLSEAASTLNLFNRTEEYSLSGLSLIDVHSQPWLYHYLRLYEALAADQLGNTSSGIDFTKAALIWAEANNAKELLLQANVTRGIQNLTLGNNDEAMTNFQQAFDLSEKVDSTISPDEMRFYIGYVYEYTRQDELAVTEYKKVKERAKNSANKVLLTKATYGMGRSTKNLGDLELGFSLLSEAIELAEKIGFSQYSAFANKELSGYFLIKKQPDDAIRVLEIARGLFEESGNPYMLMDVNFTLGRVGLQKNDTEMAEIYLSKAQEYIRSESMIPHQLALDRAVVELLSQQGKTQQALDAMKQLYRDYRDYTQKQNIKELHKLTTLYQLGKSENKNTYLQQKTMLQELRYEQQKQNYLYATVAVTVIILSLIALYLNSKKHSRLLQKLNNTDMLTQLSSRLFIMDRLNSEIEIAKRHQQPLSVASVDLDHFKIINDTFGHDVGDSVLSRFGAICKAHFRTTDLLGRVGGEEFLFCFVQTKKYEASKAIEALNEKVKNDTELKRLTQSGVSLSAGVVDVDTSLAVNENLVILDRCLYQAKKNGRDQVHLGD